MQARTAEEQQFLAPVVLIYTLHNLETRFTPSLSSQSYFLLRYFTLGDT